MGGTDAVCFTHDCVVPVLHLQVPVVFFSLLRKGTPDRDRSEAKLAEAFDYVSARSGSRLYTPHFSVAVEQLGTSLFMQA